MSKQQLKKTILEIVDNQLKSNERMKESDPGNLKLSQKTESIQIL